MRRSESTLGDMPGSFPDLRVAVKAGHEVTEDEEGPSVAEDIEGVGDGAGMVVGLAESASRL